MDKIMGIINLVESDDVIPELTGHRPLAAVPFGGRYRLIDFILSNMVNSDIDNVGILVQQKYRSILDHLRSGKEWDLARKQGGMVILPPADSYNILRSYRGDVESFYEHLDYIRNSQEKYVVISSITMIYNFNYQKAVDFHCQVNADVTVLYSEDDGANQDCNNYTAIDVDENGQVIDMQVKPGKLQNQKISMKTYIMERNLLIELIDNCVAHGDYDFVKHCIIKNLSKLKVYAYLYQGYLARIHCLQSFFRHNMELLSPAIWKELFSQNSLIYTKTKNDPPTKYIEGADVKNTLAADGCYIGGRVENCILFQEVLIHPGAYIKNSIIMPKTQIETDVILHNVICDKNVRISAGKHLRGEVNYPLVIKKGTVI